MDVYFSNHTFYLFHVIFARYDRRMVVYGYKPDTLVIYAKIYINYESSRFTAIDSHTAVITSEYSMECLKEWLEKCTPITEKTEF